MSRSFLVISFHQYLEESTFQQKSNLLFVRNCSIQSEIVLSKLDLPKPPLSTRRPNSNVSDGLSVVFDIEISDIVMAREKTDAKSDVFTDNCISAPLSVTFQINYVEYRVAASVSAGTGLSTEAFPPHHLTFACITFNITSC